MKKRDIEILSQKSVTHQQTLAKETAETNEMKAAIANLSAQRDTPLAAKENLKQQIEEAHGVGVGHDQPAGRHQDLLQVLAIDRPHDHALEGQPQPAAHRHRRQDRQDNGAEIEPQRIRAHPVAQRQHHRRRDEGADRNEGAVAEVQHVHQPEGEREA